MSRRFTTLATLGTAAMLAASMGTASAQTTTACGTAPAGYNVIESNARFVIGTPEKDFICAGPGNNIIRARGKDDIIFGGAGNDVIWAGFGNDLVYGGEGNDLIRAGGGKDIVWGEGGNDRVLAGSGPDVVHGGPGDDKLTGGEGHDIMRGNAGADTLIGNKGIDRLFGDAGNDVAQGGIGPDTVSGGAGDDNLVGGDHDDVLGGGDGADRILGGNGEDTLVGGNGNDILLGGGNPDIMRGSNGDDFIDGGNGLNTAIGGADFDTCLNADSTLTACEVVDGLELAALPARITVFFEGAAVVIIRGDDWTAATELEVLRPLLNPPEQGTPVNSPTTDASGDFEVAVSEAEMAGRFVEVFDPVTFHTKEFVPVLETFTYNQVTKELTVTGPLGKTVEAFVYNPNGTLIFVEQMSFEGVTSQTVDFMEINESIGSIDIVSSDGDGDKEIHSAFDAVA